MNLHIQINKEASTEILRALGEYLHKNNCNHLFIDEMNLSRFIRHPTAISTLKDVDYLFLYCNKNSIFKNISICELLNSIIKTWTSGEKKMILITSKPIPNAVTHMFYIDNVVKCNVAEEFVSELSSFLA